jgi:hypothetical protein
MTGLFSTRSAPVAAVGRADFVAKSWRSRRGIALISVLAMVLLLTALVVAFMMRVGTEKQASSYYCAESRTRELSDTTLNLVEGLINEATTQGFTYAWATQPGAIRVFDNTGASYKTFKLYSAPSMSALASTANPVSTFLGNDLPPATWYKAPGIWVDLNAPVNSDPNPNSSGLGSPLFTHFPILDPRDPVNSKNTIAMDGFALPAPGTTVPFDATKIDANNLPNPAPMPVQWLYVLQNGTLTAPTSGPDASGSYTFGGVGPSVGNPIVGRIAFWTDDETCKVNVNTAGADGIMGITANGHTDPSAIANGTFWSPPYFASPDDTGTGSIYGPFGPGFCTAEPEMGEYQRYPGHPATVALSNILNTLRPSGGAPYINTTNFYPSFQSNSLVPGITPRYLYGGTEENTQITFGNGTYQSSPDLTIPAMSTVALRLYPTLSEALFNPDRSSTQINTTNATARQRMETGRFFLTAHSRAPELNLFGLPRVSMWPMASTVSWRTTLDNLLGFCTTIGGTQGNTTDGSAYYFTRLSANSSTVDIGLQDSSGNYRNAWLLNYLDYLTRQNIPGFGGNFNAKDYGNGLTGQNDQILSEIFDYIRITNVQDGTSPYPYNGQFPTVVGGANYSASQGGYGGVGQVVPSLINSTTTNNILSWNTQGNGAFPRLVEATIQFVAMGRVGTMATGTGTPNGSPTGPPFPAVLKTSAVVSPSAMAYANTFPGLIGTGDSSSTLTYPYNALGSPTLDLPYTAPGAAGGAPASGPYNTIYPVYNNFTHLISGVPPDGTNAVQAFIILTFVNPAQGFGYVSPCVWASISGLSGFQLNGHPLGFPDPDGMIFTSWQTFGGGRSGYYPLDCDFDPKSCQYRTAGTPNPNPYNGYPFYSAIIPIKTDNTINSTMSFTGAPITIKLYDAISSNNVLSSANYYGAFYPGYFWFNAFPPAADGTGAPSGCHLVQTYSINFPSATFPVPVLPGNCTPTAVDSPSYYNAPAVDNRDWEFPPNSMLPLPYVGTPATAVSSWWVPSHGGGVNGAPFLAWITPNVAYGGSYSGPIYHRAGQSPQGPAITVLNCFEQSGPIIGLSEPIGSTPMDWYNSMYNRWNQNAGYFSRVGEYIGTGDTVESMVLSKLWSDPRLLCIANVPSSAWSQHPNYGQAGKPFAHNMFAAEMIPTLGNSNRSWAGGNWDTSINNFDNSPWTCPTPMVGTLCGNQTEPSPSYVSDDFISNAWAPSIFGNNMAPTTRGGLYPPAGPPIDWDSGCAAAAGNDADGPWINKADEGSASCYGAMPYYANPVLQPPQLMTANREVPSPGMLGSLPTGVDPTGNNPSGWQTLLFRPGPLAAGYPAAMKHPGEGVLAGTPVGTVGPFYTSPPDHLWMDLFWIPITEPYAISEPMSTAGKINLNYQIVPFTYIKRATALRAAMATEKIAQVSLLQSGTAKGNSYNYGLCWNSDYQKYTTQMTMAVNARYPIDLDVTLTQFDLKFKNWDLFRSASQICENFLVPMNIPNSLPNAIPGPAPCVAGAAGTYSVVVTPAGNYSLPAPGNPADTTGVAQFAKDWYVPVTTPQNPNAYTNAPFADVGDNVREQPYTHLYQKLTTKSNTFTVYYRVQPLKEPLALTSAGKWNESLGTITGEYRGSTTIERFIDPNEKTNGVNVVPDAAMEVANGKPPTSLEAYYKWRVVENHQFAP